MKRCLVDENVPFYNAEFLDISTLRPHVAFIQNPYEETRPEYLRIKELQKLGTKIAYVPYGLELGGGAWNIGAQFDTELHRYAWRIFARSMRHKKMFSKYCQSGSNHVVVTGHPKFDTLNKSNNPICDELSKKIAGRKIILWTPHFSVGDPPTWSTYKLYSEFIFSEINNRQDVFLLIRPHPLFFKAMLQYKVWSIDKELEFRREIDINKNMGLDEKLDYLDAFACSDALMTDVGSFLLEYLPTGKPLLYLHHPNGLGMNDDGDIAQYLYSASSTHEIAQFIEMLVDDKDPKKSERETILPEYLFGLGTKIGETICQHIHTSIKLGDNYSSIAKSSSSCLQDKSETYWKNANNSYLAPADYYETKERILNNVFANLPALTDAIDIGCGDGRFTFLLAKYVNSIVAYDISAPLLEQATKKANTDGINNIKFVHQPLETIAPYEKFDIITCMGVTSCIIEDSKFLHILDKFKLLSKQRGYLLLIDTLSLIEEKIATGENAYIAKYRNLEDYRTLINRRGYILQKEILIKKDSEKQLVNKLFLFSVTTDSEIV